MSVNDNKKNRGAHGDSSFMLGQTSPSSENQADITARIVKILVFKDGSTRAITGEAGKYWLTGEDRVRKLSSGISEIREVPEPVKIELSVSAPADLGADIETAKPKKKTARKKKTTEVEADGERGE